MTISWFQLCHETNGHTIKYLSALLQLHLHSNLTTGFNGLGKDNCTTRWEAFQFWDLVPLRLDVSRCLNFLSLCSWIVERTCHCPCCREEHINGLMQERRNSNVLAMELHLSCINPLIWCIRWKIIFERCILLQTVMVSNKLPQIKSKLDNCHWNCHGNDV